MTPHRFVARQLVSLWCWTYLAVATSTQTAIGQFRSGAEGPESSFGSAVQRWASGIMRWGFHRCEIRGASTLPSPAVLLVNHQSGFDIALVAYLMPPPLFFVARLEIARVPLIGSVLRGGGHVLIRRGGGAANEAAFDDAVTRLRRGGRVVFFGEGTRSSRDEVLPLRSGAFRVAARAGVPVIPLVLAGTRGTFPSGGWPIVPSRLAAEFLTPRWVTEDEARSASFREDLRREMEATLIRLAPRTGPRI